MKFSETLFSALKFTSETNSDEHADQRTRRGLAEESANVQ